jgi:hypothetical protein
MFTVYGLNFERTKETLRAGVFLAITLGAHAAKQMITLDQFQVSR